MSNKAKKAKTETQKNLELNVEYYFPTAIYTMMAPEYLAAAREVCRDYVAKRKKDDPKLNTVYPLYQTESFNEDPRIKPLSDLILNVAWDILNNQGYDMTNLRTFYREFWCQDHHKHSGMDQHTHGFGAQIVGFYFVDIPEGSPKAVFYDPKIAKVQINLPEKDVTKATPASNMINFELKPGMIMFTNAWLAHSFTRSESNKSVRFIHFTIQPLEIAVPPQGVCQIPAEVI